MKKTLIIVSLLCALSLLIQIPVSSALEKTESWIKEHTFEMSPEVSYFKDEDEDNADIKGYM